MEKSENKKINKIEKLVEIIAANVLKITDKADNIEKNVATLTDKVGNIQKDVTVIKTDLGQVKTDLRSFKENTKEDFAEVNKKIDDLTETLEDTTFNHESRIEVLEGKVAN